MARPVSLPTSDTPVIKRDGQPTREWYTFLQRLAKTLERQR